VIFEFWFSWREARSLASKLHCIRQRRVRQRSRATAFMGPMHSGATIADRFTAQMLRINCTLSQEK
jgi:hypothetical protein